jgi:hypothetical protein
MKPSSRTTRLLSYRSLSLGSTAILATQAEAATVVNVNATTFDTGLSGIGTVGFHFNPEPDMAESKSYVTFSGSVFVDMAGSFRRGDDTNNFSVGNYPSSTVQIQYASEKNAPPAGSNGAVLNSSDNWLYAVSSPDQSQRVWLQFQFWSGTGGNDGLILRAVFPDFEGELPNPAAAVAVVPEPSALILLSLGATGLAMRRRRTAA